MNQQQQQQAQREDSEPAEQSPPPEPASADVPRKTVVKSTLPTLFPDPPDAPSNLVSGGTPSKVTSSAPSVSTPAAAPAAIPPPKESALSKLKQKIQDVASSSAGSSSSSPSRPVSCPAGVAPLQQQPPHQLLHKTRNSSIISFAAPNEARHPSIISKPPSGSEDSASNGPEKLPGNPASGTNAGSLASDAVTSGAALSPTVHPESIDENSALEMKSLDHPQLSILTSSSSVTANTPPPANTTGSSSKVISTPPSSASSIVPFPSIVGSSTSSNNTPTSASYSSAAVDESIVDPETASFHRKSSISFTEPKAHAERVRSVNALYQHISQHLTTQQQGRQAQKSQNAATTSTKGGPVRNSTPGQITGLGSSTAIPSLISASAVDKTGAPSNPQEPSTESVQRPQSVSFGVSTPRGSTTNLTAIRNASAGVSSPSRTSPSGNSSGSTGYFPPFKSISNINGETSSRTGSPGSTSPTFEGVDSKNGQSISNLILSNGAESTSPRPGSKASELPYYEKAFRRDSRISIIIPPLPQSTRTSYSGISISSPSARAQSPIIGSPAPIQSLQAAIAQSSSPGVTMNIQPHPGRQPQQQQQQQQVHIQLPQTPISTTAKSPPLSPKSAEKKASNPDKVNSIDAELEKTEDDDNNEDYHKIHILIAVTGSVATIKIPLIISKLRQIYGKYAVVQLIVTSSAQHFLNTVKLPQGIKVWHDSDEWSSRRGAGTEVSQQLHVQLRRWADILLVAPLSANTLAKMANGICDNLITSIFRAWNPKTPVVVAPAMNTHMYTNPMTKKHLDILSNEYPYVTVLKPIEKVLVCGDIGMGGMREWTDVVDNLVRHLGGPPTIEDDDENDDDSEDDDEKREKQKKKREEKRRKKRDNLDVGQPTNGGALSALSPTSGTTATSTKTPVSSMIVDSPRPTSITIVPPQKPSASGSVSSPLNRIANGASSDTRLESNIHDDDGSDSGSDSDDSDDINDDDDDDESIEAETNSNQKKAPIPVKPKLLRSLTAEL